MDIELDRKKRAHEGANDTVSVGTVVQGNHRGGCQGRGDVREPHLCSCTARAPAGWSAATVFVLLYHVYPLMVLALCCFLFPGARRHSPTCSAARCAKRWCGGGAAWCAVPADMRVHGAPV